jgi:class 3 adenylate cyclase/tetratricopeptide (TPR) repeat protein
MQCPKCQFENRDEAKFCGECGHKFQISCPECGTDNRIGNKFCDECGSSLNPPIEASDQITKTKRQSVYTDEKITDANKTPLGGERKHVTVLFSDLSGYTAMSEKLDPEDLKEITGRIFGEISKIVEKYDGFIEKYAGDAVMAIFGVPKAHEDDPIRAVKVAREIHETVHAISPELERKIGQSISMHTGINTGLVVTGDIDMAKGVHGVAGETVNIASRLCSLANRGDILAGLDTHKQAEGHFVFEGLKPTKVKGKKDPIQVFKLISLKEKPATVHRLTGLRSVLTGRKAELSELVDAVKKLKEREGRIFSICGTAGTGKSRLVEEFKNTLNLENMQWLEGHAYAYSQNIPYFPFVDLLNKIFRIEEDNPFDVLKQKVESGMEDLLGKNDYYPFIGSLYALNYDEVENVSPEFRKLRLQEAAQAIISALARKKPTIFFLEDLHWADPSFIELLHYTLLHTREPAIVLCAYRPIFSLYTSHQLSSIPKIYQEIRLKDLSSSEAQDMLESLLKTEAIPSELKRFVQQKAEGNPFYLEELVNSLIESATLIQENNKWKITRPITNADISPTIHGLISGRLDRLEDEIKRILQEASVIGRAFLYEILKRITELTVHIDRNLSTLERLDLIRTKSLQPDLEYMFKHPLTQEVVYNSILKKDRQAIHEQVASVMEQNFQDRLPEFYETLAYHFKQGRSRNKAVDYLIKSGEKSVERFAVEEAHRYYKEAFELLSNKTERSNEDNEILIDLLSKWSLVFYYRGDFAGQTNLLEANENVAISIDDKSKKGMFFAWLGWTYFFRGKLTRSFQYLSKALEIGKEIGDERVIGYACTWLSFTCPALGRMDEGIDNGKIAQEISRKFKKDHYLYFKSLSGIGFCYFWKGNVKEVFYTGRSLIEFSQMHSNPRASSMGYWIMQYGALLEGDYAAVVDWMENGIKLSVDPLYSIVPKLYLGMGLAFTGQIKRAEELLTEFVSYCQEMGNEIMELQANWFLGIISIASGQMSHGLNLMEHSQQKAQEFESPVIYALGETLIGNVYLQIVEKSAPLSVSTATKNIMFLLKNVPFAAAKTKEHFMKAAEIAQETGAKSILGQASWGLGRMYKAKSRRDQTSYYISKAIDMFKQCEVDGPLKQAEEVLESLK